MFYVSFMFKNNKVDLVDESELYNTIQLFNIKIYYGVSTIEISIEQQTCSTSISSEYLNKFHAAAPEVWEPILLKLIIGFERSQKVELGQTPRNDPRSV